MLYWRLDFVNEILVNCSFTQLKWTYILDFGPLRWSALNMGFVDKWPSRMQGEWYFRSRTGKSFRLGPENFHFSLGGCPCLNLPPQKVRGGGGGRGLASPSTNMRGMCEVYPHCGDIICPVYRQALIIHICANVPSRHSHSSWGC